MTEPLHLFVEFLKGTSDEFEKAHPESFLVFEPFQRFETGAYRTTPGSAVSQTVGESVAAIRKSPGANAFAQMITLGRAANNDVVVPGASVSKFHAYFMADPTGGLTLTDAGSTLGTFVNERKLAPKTDCVKLKPGDAIRLGEIRLNFHSPASFFSYLKALT